MLLYFIRASTVISSDTGMIPTGVTFYRLVSVTLMTLYLFLLTGSYVTRSGASLACLGFPLCGSVSDAIRDLVNIHLIHRHSAFVAAAMLLSIAYVLANVYVNLEIRYFGHSIFVLLITQIVLGAANILLRIPMWSRILHLAVGVSLWVCVEMLWMILTIGRSQQFKISK